MTALASVSRLLTGISVGVMVAILITNAPASAAITNSQEPTVFMTSNPLPIGAVEVGAGMYHLPGDATLTIEGYDLAPTQLADITAISLNRGVPLRQAIEDFLWQEQFGQVATRLEEEFPREYTGARRLEERGGPYIAFRGEVPVLARALVAELPRSVRLIGGRGFSQSELVETLTEAFSVLVDTGKVANATGTADDSNGLITIRAVLKEHLTPAESDLARVSLEPLAPENRAIGIKLSIVEHLDEFRVENDVRGGSHFHLSPSTSSTSKCTTGYTVRQTSSGREGVATAGHCQRPFGATTRWYANHSLSGWRGYALEQAHEGSLGDISWYRVTGERRLPQFFSHTGLTRTVAATNGNPQLDDDLCKYGVETGHGCARVIALNDCVFGSQGQICSLTRMNAHITGGGDSGGPWFASRTPYGIHAGAQGGNSLFTRVGRLSNAFGVVLIR